jgi:hypothetical protein
MFNWLKNLFVNKDQDVDPAFPFPKSKDQAELAPYKVEPVSTEVAEVVSKRAKDARGKFVANDKSTPENEAWVGGKAPAKKKTPAKKPAAGARGRKPKATTVKK